MKTKVKPPPNATTYKIPGQDPIYGDPEFQALLDPLTAAELGTLEANIIADDRVIDPIVVWKEARIVLDGYNRLSIAGPRNIRYAIVFKSFPLTSEGRQKALEWVIDHQLGRRNLSEEAKKKKVEWRRDRVAAKHKAGDSNRTIAKNEKVSEATVRRDIQETGAAIATPDKVMGQDGKEYGRSRAERVGQKDTIPFVPKGERLAGDDTKQLQRDRTEAKSDPKNGQIDFDWGKFNREFANFLLWVDKLGKLYRKNHSAEATKLRQDFMNWKNDFKKWGEAISKKEATPDVVDKVRGRGRPKKGS